MRTALTDEKDILLFFFSLSSRIGESVCDIDARRTDVSSQCNIYRVTTERLKEERKVEQSS